MNDLCQYLREHREGQLTQVNTKYIQAGKANIEVKATLLNYSFHQGFQPTVFHVWSQFTMQ